MKHNYSTYSNHGCRCESCTESHRRKVAAYRAQRFEDRVLLGGRLVATGVDVVHGLVDTYSNHGCRCIPCTVANRECDRYKRQKRKAS